MLPVSGERKLWSVAISGAGTNLKVGERGGTRPAEIFFVVPPHFLALQVQSVVFGERFGDGQYSVVSFLFAVLLLTVPPCPAICQSVGVGTCPRAPWSRRH